MDKALQHYINNIFNMTVEEQYDYLIRTCVEWEQVWAYATADGYVSFKDTTGDEIFPIYPNLDLANYLLDDACKDLNAQAKVIKLDKFITICIDDMIKEKIYFGIIYNKNQYLAVTGMKLREDFIQEMKYQDIDTTGYIKD